jgi:Tol biopolymer transport system component
VNTDGSNRKLLRVQTGVYTKLSFSADGQYLAATFDDTGIDSGYDGHTVIYDALGGAQINALTSTWAYFWSPIGHQLAMINSGGADVITDPGNLQPQKPIGKYCSSVAWNPAR